jgi:serine/threonine-protein kinase HipA
MKALCVERFDRRWTTDGRLLRLPQEDFAQVFGVPPDIKYESQGGPGIRQILDQLNGSSQAQIDRRDFFRTQVLFWMLAAIDGHAKNFSVFIEAKGFYRITHATTCFQPTRSWGMVPDGFPRTRSKWPWQLTVKIDITNGQRFVVSTLNRQRNAAICLMRSALIGNLIDQTPKAIAEVAAKLPSNFPDDLAKSIFDGLMQAANALGNSPSPSEMS